MNSEPDPPLMNNGASKESCNCDAQVPLWAQDLGIITAIELLPISSLLYGPLQFEIEQANFTLGPLKCSGM